MKIKQVNCNFEREPLLAPFGFKGGYVNEAWQVVAQMRGERHKGVGLGLQSVLWSDAGVFSHYPEATGNCLMFMLTAFALNAAKDIEWETPLDLLDQLLEPTYEYAKKISGKNDLRLTFALNALVAVDNAAWQLYCRENHITSFDQMIPAEIKPALNRRHGKLAAIPLMTYGIRREQIVKALDEGYFFLKIKIGSDPVGDGDRDKMLEWDKKRLTEIHEIAKDRETPYTDSGKIPYYFDANGRYDSKDRLWRFLEHADKIGALEQIIIVEEPFPEEFKEDLSDIPVRLAADESAHSCCDVEERIAQGYTAIALKPIAKTMSMSLKIAKLAHEQNIPCFCADLTVNPAMVDWNKNVAARLAPLPGMKIGVLESNGHQNYVNWEKMMSYHSCAGASWLINPPGLFVLDDNFYAESGGILKESIHYNNLVEK